MLVLFGICDGRHEAESLSHPRVVMAVAASEAEAEEEVIMYDQQHSYHPCLVTHL